MTLARTGYPTPRKPLRLWPGVVAAVLLLLVRFVVPIVEPEAMPFGVIGGLVGGLAIVVWWVVFSRAPWSERLGAVVVMIVATVATSRVVHVSIATGMMGMMFPVYAIPSLSLAFVVWAVASRRLSDGPRRAAMVARHPTWVRSMDARPDQWRFRRRRFGFRVAVVGDCRRTAPGAESRRRAGGAPGRGPRK